MIKYIGLFLGAVLISSISQILLKKSANQNFENSIREYLNPKVVIAYIMFFGATLINVWAYKKVPLAMGPVLESSGYVFVTVLGVVFLKEHVSKRKLLGLLMILLGIFVFSYRF